jgi:hypothetical protein
MNSTIVDNIFTLNLTNIKLLHKFECKYKTFQEFCTFQIQFKSKNNFFNLIDQNNSSSNNYVHRQTTPVIQFNFKFNNNKYHHYHQDYFDKFENIFETAEIIVIFKTKKKTFFGLEYSSKIVTFNIPLNQIINKLTYHEHFNPFSKLEFDSKHLDYRLTFECDFREECINFQHVIRIENKYFNSIFTNTDENNTDNYPYLILPDYDNDQQENNNKKSSESKMVVNHHLKYYDKIEVSRKKYEFRLKIDKIDAKSLTGAQLVLPSFDYFWQDNLFNNIYSCSKSNCNYWDITKNYIYAQNSKINNWYSMIAGKQYFQNSPIFQLDNFNKNIAMIMTKRNKFNHVHAYQVLTVKHPDFHKSPTEILQQLEEQIILHFNRLRILKLEKSSNEKFQKVEEEYKKDEYANLIAITLNHTVRARLQQ